jgi:hypothetical protein
VTAALALAGAVLFIGAGLGWSARLAHIANLDASALADKLAHPHPACAAEWPELQVCAVVPQPDLPSVVLLQVSRPLYPEQAATMLVQFECAQAAELLSRWCGTNASIAPRANGDQLELRRRRTLERLRGRLIAEDMTPGVGGAPPAAITGTTGPR